MGKHSPDKAWITAEDIQKSVDQVLSHPNDSSSTRLAAIALAEDSRELQQDTPKFRLQVQNDLSLIEQGKLPDVSIGPKGQITSVVEDSQQPGHYRGLKADSKGVQIQDFYGPSVHNGPHHPADSI